MPLRPAHLALAAAAALAAATPAHAAGPRPAPAVAGKAQVPAARLASCLTGAAPAGRAAVYSASMSAATVPGTRRMAVRFSLLEQVGPEGSPAAVPVPGWGSWEKSQAGRSAFSITKRVDGLVPGDLYSAAVTMRWIGRGGKTLRTTKMTTRACAQPDDRPDVRAGALTGRRTAGGAEYDVVVRNEGADPAPAFLVGVLVAGQLPARALAPPLAAGESAHVRIPGAACAPGSGVTVLLDPGQVVDEADETDSAVVRPCPLPAP